jgi:hypothetical protein
MTTIDIRDFQIVPERDSGRPIVAYEVEDFRRDGGDDYGAVIVRINVDGSFDLVQVDLVQTGDLAVLDRAIRALGDVRSELEVLYGAGGRGRGAAWRAGITGAVRRPRARGRPRVPHRGRVASRARRPVEGEGREGRELADVHSTRCPPRTRDLGGHRRVDERLPETLLVERQFPIAILAHERATEDGGEQFLALALSGHLVDDDTRIRTQPNHLWVRHVVTGPWFSARHRAECLLALHDAEGKGHQCVLGQMLPVVTDTIIRAQGFPPTPFDPYQFLRKRLR